MKISSLLILPILGWFAAVSAQAEITLRVSVKFILDSSGNRPPPTFVDDSSGKTKNSAIDTDPKVQAYIDYANQMLIKHRRGYRMQLLLPIQEVSGHSEWFNMDATSEVGDLENAVVASFVFDDNEFLFDPSAINIYIVNGQTAGACACGNPSSSDIIALSQSINPDWVILHESGHYLGLPHTQDGEQFLFGPGVECKMSGTKDNCDCPIVIPGDDGIADTLRDVSCWTIDDLSQNAFGGNFASLTASQQLKVSNTYSNIMAYHGTKSGSRNVLTSDQLDVMADYANSTRDNVATGITWFVDRDNSSGSPFGNSKSILGIGGPFPKVEQGIAVATANDIVLVRPGTYTDTTLLNKALTLRATRGNATLRASP